MAKKFKEAKSKPWKKEKVEVLLDAYRDEPVLYETDSPNYHSKHLREEAANRVVEKVKNLRPDVSPNDCLRKINNMRSEYNKENAKITKSKRSGVGGGDVST